MKKFLKSIVPEWVFSIYYRGLALLGAFYYGFPSEKMIVVGITGTKGKTSTANFIWSCAMSAGIKAGIVTTANIRIGDKEILNPYHMTMPGRFTIQRLLAEMVREGCRLCVVETTSEGLKQSRHVGVEYDFAVFTNLTPEHLPSHGGDFENYKRAKGVLFSTLSKTKRKFLDNQEIGKVIVANTDSEHAQFFVNFLADKKISFGLREKADFNAKEIKETASGVTFSVGDRTYALSLLGAFNVYNALPAMIVLRTLGVTDEVIAKGLSELKMIPGRMELIDSGQDFTLIVDYAHEKQSITGVLDTARAMTVREGGVNHKVIILLGAEGGGRDKAKRPIIGELSAKKADYVVVSNVDPYEDDPREIVEDIAVVAEKFGKVRGQDLFVIEDRRAGIAKAISMAKVGDIVLITGKGAEQSMIIGGKSIPWDDRVVVREELKKLLAGR